MVWAGQRGRGGTTGMGPADRAEGFVAHTHGGPGAGQVREPDPSPKSSTEPQEAPAPEPSIREEWDSSLQLPLLHFKVSCNSQTS